LPAAGWHRVRTACWSDPPTRPPIRGQFANPTRFRHPVRVDTKDLITIGVAAYGAVLSTFVFIIQRIDKCRKIRVTASHGFGVPGGEQLLVITAANIGHVNVTLSSFALRLPNRSQMILPYSQQEFRLPHELKPGQAAKFLFPLNEVLRGLLEHGYHGTEPLVPVVDDQAGAIHRGKAVRLGVPS